MDELIARRLALGEWVRQRVADNAMSRRKLLGSAGALSGLTLLGCSGGGSNSTAAGATSTPTTTTGTTATTTTTTATTPGSCVLIPQETVGPSL